MRSFVLFALLSLFAACSDEPPPASSPAAAVADFCEHVCGWADKCGQFAPQACGELCSAPSCEDACTAEVKPPATSPAPAELAACLEGVDASARDCTSYRPRPADCGTFLELPEGP